MSETGSIPVGGKMSYWIGVTLQREREAAGVTRQQVAAALDSHEHTIKRLEEGRSMGRDIDQAIAAFAFVLGLEDGRELWGLALDWWYAEGSPPRFKPVEGPAEAFAEAIRAQAMRSRQRDARERSVTRPAIRKKQTGG